MKTFLKLLEKTASKIYRHKWFVIGALVIPLVFFVIELNLTNQSLDGFERRIFEKIEEVNHTNRSFNEKSVNRQLEVYDAFSSSKSESECNLENLGRKHQIPVKILIQNFSKYVVKFETDKVGKSCLIKFTSMIEGTTYWIHPFILSTKDQISLGISNKRPNGELSVAFHSQINRSAYSNLDVSVWYTGLKRGKKIDGVSFDGTNVGIKLVTDSDIEFFKNVASAEETILRVDKQEIELSNSTKNAINEIISVWQNYRNHFISIE